MSGIGTQTRVDDTHPESSHSSCGTHFGEAEFLATGDHHHRPSGGLGKQLDERIDIIGEPQSRTDATTKSHLDNSDRETSIGYVVGGSDHSVARCSDENLAQHLLSLKIEQRWESPEMSPPRAGEMGVLIENAALLEEVPSIIVTMAKEVGVGGDAG